MIEAKQNDENIKIAQNFQPFYKSHNTFSLKLISYKNSYKNTVTNAISKFDK